MNSSLASMQVSWLRFLSQFQAMMIHGQGMTTSTVTMANPSQWIGSTTVWKTVPAVRMRQTWADMKSSCAMMAKPSQWIGLTTVWKTAMAVKMKPAWTTMTTTTMETITAKAITMDPHSFVETVKKSHSISSTMEWTIAMMEQMNSNTTLMEMKSTGLTAWMEVKYGFPM